jgi:superfamily I DNA/RNA helicase
VSYRENLEKETITQEMVLQKVALQTLVQEAIDRSRYDDYLKEDPETCMERRENLAELVTKAAEWDQENPQGTLEQFLEELTLKTSEESENGYTDSVKLMTFHNGKGLEFSVVFLVGMEEDLFPHMNSRDEPSALEEERRLCYVGMTRAKAYLYLTSARSRFLWGGARTMRPKAPLIHVNTAAALPAYMRGADDRTSRPAQRGDLCRGVQFTRLRQSPAWRPTSQTTRPPADRSRGGPLAENWTGWVAAA